ncbi:MULTISPECIES: hypothetical protein [Elizabethkingia]|uniref:hypothetical protein n=1 Tax=Elizabethkingia TaxID=308865 RepID=UPI0021A5FE22|nr:MULTISPECIES: hypothetical protein [Elizabethkingia]MCT3689546.1 hypothetical protein [Elizabethkingia anophelis]MCT3706365.1 hypothetical protein [Elizabethkingia anophelis]MCT3713384.1 hypothetical protein [Elizabethkingia anophelis]MCT3716802.1 hypothetical protein [Elizabethkingia anophelis]MCT3730439.1 hypothetical protein [Elizabethkingia anophelis]
MSEFKGSKGEWKLAFAEENKLAIRTSQGILMKFWKPDKYPGQDERYESELQETKANQILCSKAPEMLEMLKRCEARIEPKDIHISLLNDLRQLIKEATE